MVTSVRFDPAIERTLAKLSRLTGKTKSELIRQAVRQLTTQAERRAETSPTAYEQLADMVGVVNLGPGNRAARSEEILREMFAARRRRR